MDLFLLEYDLLARVKRVVGSLLHHLENEEHFTSTSDRSKGTNNGSQFEYVHFVFSHFQRFFGYIIPSLRDIGFGFYRVFIIVSLSISLWKIICFSWRSILSILIFSVLLFQAIVFMPTDFGGDDTGIDFLAILNLNKLPPITDPVFSTVK